MAYEPTSPLTGPPAPTRTTPSPQSFSQHPSHAAHGPASSNPQAYYQQPHAHSFAAQQQHQQQLNYQRQYQQHQQHQQHPPPPPQHQQGPVTKGPPARRLDGPRRGSTEGLSQQQRMPRRQASMPMYLDTEGRRMTTSSSAAPPLPMPHMPDSPMSAASAPMFSRPQERAPRPLGNASNGRSASARGPTAPPDRSMSLGSAQLVQDPRGGAHGEAAPMTNAMHFGNAYGTSRVPESRAMSLGGAASRQGSVDSLSMSREGSHSSRERADRMSSMTSMTSPTSTITNMRRPSLVPGAPSIASTIYTTSKRAPIVTPSLLSCVAYELRARIHLADHIKDGLAYKDAFRGCDAVDTVSYIIKTTDRNLALLLGRSLDAQKFFHDVTYDHRLRDSMTEVYQFRDSIQPFSEESFSSTSKSEAASSTPSLNTQAEDFSTKRSGNVVPPAHGEVAYADGLPNGVFTLLTECYSPTCTRDRLCYSIACPRRLEQQARLNMKPQPGLKRENSRGSLNGLEDADSEQRLWIHTVPKDVLEGVDEEERKRQEVICELVYTERDFVRDLEYLRDFWIKPLITSAIIPEQRRDKFIRTVFGNVLEILNVNSRLAEALTKRQHARPVVYSIVDIFFDYVSRFEPFIRYGANQLYGKYEFEREKSSNPAFSRFVSETERLRESRKLELNGYLTKPTTRLARYPLLLEAVRKHTKESNPDHGDIPVVVERIRAILARLNAESGKSENRFNLIQLNQQLQYKPGEYYDLQLLENCRELIFRGVLKRRNVSGSNSADTSSDLQLFLFDHALVFVKTKMVSKREIYRVHRKPIPLEFLIPTQYEDMGTQKGSLAKRPSSSLLPGSSKSNGELSNGKGYALTFTHLGRRGYTLTLYATTYVSRKKWMEHIENQQRVLMEKHAVFQSVLVNEKYFIGANKLNCTASFDGGRRLVFGTDNGVYVADRRPQTATKTTPERVLAITGVTQVDVIEEYMMLLVLADKTLYSYPLDSLDTEDKTLSNKRGRKVAGHTSFFKAGVCAGAVLVCVVRSSVLNTTIKVLEPVENPAMNRRKPAFKKLLAGGQDPLRVYKELGMPAESTSIHFLKKTLCVGCSKGFEVVNLEKLETQSLLDPADTSLEFVEKRENVKPLAIYRLNGEFLLCYSEFALYVNKHGWRTRPEWFVTWEGVPQGFALSYPYIIAFEPSFIEIRHVETSELQQVITGTNIRLLADGRGTIGEGGEILYACDDKSSSVHGGSSILYSLIMTGPSRSVGSAPQSRLRVSSIPSSPPSSA